MFQSTEITDKAAQTVNEISAGLEQLRNSSINDLFSELPQRLVNFAIDIAIAILVFYVGKFIIKRIYRIVATILMRREVEKSLSSFILSFVKIVLYFILIITVIGILGIETSSFLALFASAGVAIGMALSGTLQNFAGGVLILLLKPYKIGDYIEAQGYAGTVREIQIFHTIITTYDNKSIIIPNGGLSTSSINNWSTQDYRRVEWEIAISYGDSVDAARKAILDMFATDPRILKKVDEEKIVLEEYNKALAEEENSPTVEPRKRGLLYRLFHRKSKVKEAIERWQEKQDNHLKALKPCVTSDASVVVNKLADSSLLIEARAWVKNTDYWSVYYHYNERFYNELPNYGINFPFPQMDLHIKQ